MMAVTTIISSLILRPVGMIKMTCKRCCAAFVTLWYGCRCKRHDRRSTAISERLWFAFLVVSVLLTFTNMYLWLVSANEERLFDLGFWGRYRRDFKFYFAFQTASFVLFGYPFILLLFACFHMSLKEYLHLHAIHKVLLSIVDLITVTVLVLSIFNTSFLWHFIPLSLMFFGPFMHLLAVIVMTIITWFIAGAFGTLERKGEPGPEKAYQYENATLFPQEALSSSKKSDHSRYALRRRPLDDLETSDQLPELLPPVTSDARNMLAKDKRNPVRDISVWYFLLLLALYACPLFIKSPCILEDKDLTPKPRLFAHKGAEHIAPENTMASFERAVSDCEVYGLESDVRISEDGVHFCLHDSTLERTTNVETLFPSKVTSRAERFSFSDLQTLDAGSWFLKRDPFGTVSELSDEQRASYKGQTLPRLTDLLDLAMKNRLNILFDLRPPPEGHTYEGNFKEFTVQKLKEYGIEDDEMDIWKAPNGPHYVVFIKRFDKRKLENMYNNVTFESIREKKRDGISTNVWTVNKRWVFSLFWCGQAYSVTTSYCRDLRDMEEPSWQLTRTHYFIMWIMYDVVSFLWVIIFLVCQIRRKRKRILSLDDEERHQERQEETSLQSQ